MAKTHNLDGVRVGDIVSRWIGGVSSGMKPMQLLVTEVARGMIICGPWTFDLATGAEIDEDLGWGPHGTGSLITKD